MVYALATSKKAKNVIKTSVDLARQEEGDEMFGSSALARVIVRRANNINDFLVACNSAVNVVVGLTAVSIKMRLFCRRSCFRSCPCCREPGTVRIADYHRYDHETSLSTTYVTFIVAMGTSLGRPCLEP